MVHLRNHSYEDIQMILDMKYSNDEYGKLSEYVDRLDREIKNTVDYASNIFYKLYELYCDSYLSRAEKYDKFIIGQLAIDQIVNDCKIDKTSELGKIIIAAFLKIKKRI